MATDIWPLENGQKNCVALLDKASAQCGQGFETVYQTDSHTFAQKRRLNHYGDGSTQGFRLDLSWIEQTIHDTPPSRFLCHCIDKLY